MVLPPARVIPNKREIITFYQDLSNAVNITESIIKRERIDLNEL